MNASALFAKAHQLTQAGVARFGGSYRVAFAAALKAVYAELRTPVAKLKALGNEWQKGGMHRIYFNDLPAWFGLRTRHYATGNISSASLDGEAISNSRAKKIHSALAFAKLWFDVTSGQFAWRGLAEADAATIIRRLQAA